MRNLKMLTVALAASLALAACVSGNDEAQPAPETSTVTEPAPEPSTVTETAEPEPEPEATPVDSDLVDSMLESVWTETPESDRSSICDGMGLAPDMMIDVFMEEFYAGGDMDGIEIDRQQIENFFMGKCGL